MDGEAVQELFRNIRRLTSAPDYSKIEIGGRAFALIVRDAGEAGAAVERIDLDDPPEYIRESVKLRTTADIAHYVKRFRGEDGESTVVFCDPDGLAFTAYLDYHWEEADRCVHTAACALRLSPELRAWAGQDWNAGKPLERLMAQIEFSNFLRENMQDVDGDAAALAQLAIDFSIASDGKFRSAHQEQSGDRKLLFENTTVPQITIPETFAIRIPLFEGGELASLEARFLYRQRDGQLLLGYRIPRVQRLLREHFTALKDALQTALPKAALYLGSKA